MTLGDTQCTKKTWSLLHLEVSLSSVAAQFDNSASIERQLDLNCFSSYSLALKLNFSDRLAIDYYGFTDGVPYQCSEKKSAVAFPLLSPLHRTIRPRLRPQHQSRQY